VNVFLAGGSRTPIGGFNGCYRETTAPQLASIAIRQTLEHAEMSKEEVSEVIIGNVLAAGLGQNVARQATLGSGLPATCHALAVNKMCGSALCAIRLAWQTIQSGFADAIIAGGTENMTRAPYMMMKARNGFRMGHGEILDAMIYDGLTDAYSGKHMGELAENCAKRYELTRNEQDEFAVASYERSLAAQKAGHFKREIAPVEVKDRKKTLTIEQDEEPAKFNAERTRTLRPAFDPEGTITAGNASSISDGAASFLVISEKKAEALGVRCQARILGYASVSLEPEWFTIAPIEALRVLSQRTNIDLDTVDLFEINEAFSVVPLAAMRALNLPHEKVNVFGGAVSLGHPIGASGARIMATLLSAMEVHDKKIGVATACIGGGEAGAIAIERITGA
jgi:acetyl-CoA C-acetyltransferase